MITLLTSQYKALELVRPCIENVRTFYPDLPFVVVDDGSRDESTKWLVEWAKIDKCGTTVISEDNLGQGGALHLGIQSVQTRYVFTLHTDTTFKKHGLVAEMQQIFEEDPDIFAVGPKVPLGKNDYWYMWNFAMMMDMNKYYQVRPFITTGGPFAAHTMIDAQDRGWCIKNVDVYNYIEHEFHAAQRVLRAKIDSGEFTHEDWKHTSRHFKGRFRRFFNDA